MPSEQITRVPAYNPTDASRHLVDARHNSMPPLYQECVRTKSLT